MANGNHIRWKELRPDEKKGDAPVRVALVAPSLEILGGQAVQASRLLEGFENEPGVDVFLVPINPRLPGPLAALQRIKYVRTLVTSVAYVWNLTRALPAADVLHIFSASYLSFVLAPTPALVLSRILGKPTILNYHSGEAQDHLQRWKTTAIPTLRLATRIVVPSGYLVDVFRRFGLSASAIWNVVEVDRFPYRIRTNPRPVFLSNRNLEKHYGVDTVLRAFRRIQHQKPEARLLVVGSGAEEEALRSLAENLDLKHVSFLGKVSPLGMTELYDRADIYLNASRIDNMPLSILEAFASGLPVVTTDTGGIPYIVDSDRTALVVPPDRPELMATEALRLLKEPGLAEQLSSQARAEVEARYRPGQILPQWVALYRELADRRERPSPEIVPKR